MKLLFIASYPKDLSPSQRFRFDCYLEHLKNVGIEVTYSPILSPEEYFRYNSSTFVKAKIFLKQFTIRLKDIFDANSYDVIFIQREAGFLPVAFFEKRLARSRAKIIYDFDDAIFLPAEGSSGGFLSRHRKIPEIIGLANVVIAGNQFLVDYAKRFNSNTTIIPTVIDTEVFKPLPKPQSEQVVIGWSGSPSTLRVNFIPFTPVLEKIKEKYGDKVVIKAMGGDFYENKKLQMKSVPFSREKELEFINSFDIGLMPLEDTPWMKGKCGLKALIYMSLEIPAVVSPVGVNKEIVREGIDGFHATTEEEWIEKLSRLIEDELLRKKLGKNARERVIQNYSVKAWKDKFIEVIKNS